MAKLRRQPAWDTVSLWPARVAAVRRTMHLRATLLNGDGEGDSDSEVARAAFRSAV